MQIFIKRPVMAIAINLVVFLIGVVAYYQLELRHLPKVATYEVKINTAYPGANYLAVEHQVTKPLEDALAGLEGIQKINSNTQDGMSSIHVKFKRGLAMDRAMGQVRDRVLAVSSYLPESVKRPEVVEESSYDRGILYLMIEDDTRSVAELSDYIRRVIEDRLRLVEGVASLNHFGNSFYLVSIKPDPALLVEHQISIREVVEALRRERVYASGGEVEGVTQRESVVLTARIHQPQDFDHITIKSTPEGRITIGDVATVSVGEKPTQVKMRVDGQYRVGLEVKAKPQANPLEVVSRVKAFIETLNPSLPESMHVYISYDVTRPFFEAFAEIRHTLWLAVALVGFIMTLSLASIRAAILPMLTVPLCLVGTFAVMWFLQFSLNPVTLLALVLAVGLVVDDAIVVVENIHQQLESHLSAMDAAIKSMKEISFSVVVMTLTLAAVYMPLIFQVDETSILFREFAWTLAGSVFISGFVALTLTPALCAIFLKKGEKMAFWDNLGHRYAKVLTKSLGHPKKMTLVLLGIAVLGVVGFSRLPMEVLPSEDEGYIQGSIYADNPVSDAVRENWFTQTETVLNAIPEREKTLTGIWNDRWMWWVLVLKPSDERSRDTHAISMDLESKFKQVVGPEVMISNQSSLTGDSSLKVSVLYPGDQAILSETVENIATELRKYPEFPAVMSDYMTQSPRLQVVVDRQLAQELGVTTEAIEDTLYTFLSGRKATDFNFEGLDYDVEVRASKEMRSELNSLNSYFVAGSDGQWVPLGTLVSMKEVVEPNQVKHYDRIRGGSMTVSTRSDVSLEKAMAILSPVVQKYLPKDATFRFGGKAEHFKEIRQNTWLTFGLSLSFIYLVLAALFESFLYPFIVLLTVPLSITGAVWVLVFLGQTNNAYTLIGLVTLMGLITKHGILIVDFANRYRQNHPLKEAVVLAAQSRLRPVLITTFAMVCGAIPLLMSTGSGAVARQDIGWIIIAGMSIGTLFSLWVIPVMYAWIASKKRVH